MSDNYPRPAPCRECGHAWSDHQKKVDGYFCRFYVGTYERCHCAARLNDDEIREAAQELRWRASGAAGEPWVRNGVNGIHARRGTCIATSERRGEEDRRADADYIATMHPGVGLALADWLEYVAERFPSGGISYHHALTVARSINRGA